MVLTENWTLNPRPSMSDLVDIAVEAESAGVDGVMVSDHVVLGPSSNESGEALNLRDYAMPGNQDRVRHRVMVGVAEADERLPDIEGRSQRGGGPVEQDAERLTAEMHAGA